MIDKLIDGFYYLFNREDKRQEIRLRRWLYALYGAAIHTLVCLLLWIDNLFRVSAQEFLLTFYIMWSVHFAFFGIIRSGINKRLEDPSLTIPMMVWGITCLMYTVYLTTELRSLLLMFNFFTLVFGTFHLGVRTFMLISLYGIFSYLAVIGLLDLYYPNFIDLREEWISFSCFSLVSFAYIVIASEMANIRAYLHEKHEKLTAALKYIESVSVTDELTGIKNRRYILGVLESQRLMSERGQYVFSICMLDIDHFKTINDTYGHICGDNVLIHLCKTIGATMRKIDHFARYGGEEFLFVLPFTDGENARLTGERIRKLVQDTDFSAIVPNLKVTVSLGTTEFHWPEDVETLIARVDAAMYEAKKDGRNRVISH